MRDITKLIRLRNRYLALAAMSLLIWQGPKLLAALPRADALTGPLAVAELIGALGWVAASLLFLVYASRLGRSGAQGVIQDELFHDHQARAVRAGFIAVMALVSALFLAAQFLSVPLEPAARALFLTGVCVPVFSFLLLQHRADREDAA